MGTKGATRERTDNKIMEPKKFHVVMWNDDFTTMEFVVQVLVHLFHKDQVTANTLMMKVHQNGHAIVGTYPYDIAMTKVATALSWAKEQGYPFRMTVEEE